MLSRFGVIILELRDKVSAVFLFAPYWEREVSMAESVGVYAASRRGIQMCILWYALHYLRLPFQFDWYCNVGSNCKENCRHADKCQGTELSNAFVYLVYGKTVKEICTSPAKSVSGVQAVSLAPLNGGILSNW